MPSSLFTSETPAVDGTDGSPGITTATTFRAAVDGTVTHVRFYATASPAGTFTGLLWQRTANDSGGGGTGTLLASKTFSGTPTGSTWNTIELDDPVPITADTTYRVGLHNPTQYVATNNFFTSALTTGDLTADANGETGQHLGLIGQGTFLIDASPGYPRQVGSSASYFIDVVFAPTAEAVTGTVAATLPALTVAAVGTPSSSGTVTAVLPALTAAATGTASAVATVAAVLPALRSAATGTSSSSGTVAAVLPALTAAVIGVMDLGEASSPTRALATVSRSAEINTITRDRVLATGTSPGGGQ